MPSFEIPDGPTAIDIIRPREPGSAAPARGSAGYDVTNRSGEGRYGRLSIQVPGGAQADWFGIEGERERHFAPGETQRVTVTAAIPNDVPGGDFPFHLRIVAVDDPDNDHADGPVTVAKLLPAATGGRPRPRWWIWLLVALGILLLLGLGAYLLFGGTREEPRVAVPDFVGRTVEQAKADARGFALVESPGAPAGKAARTILSQDPAAGSLQPRGAEVRVTFDPGSAGQCRPGFVWREAGPADRVCVTPESRALVRAENREADARRSPTGGAYGPMTCRMGFVWREAFAGDYVCVTGERRTAVREENRLAAQRTF